MKKRVTLNSVPDKFQSQEVNISFYGVSKRGSLQIFLSLTFILPG